MIMTNVIASIFFLICSFMTWISVVFNILDKISGQHDFFSNIGSAVTVYIFSALAAIIMTVISFKFVCFIQLIF